MKKNPSQYYLFNSGSFLGPISEERLKSLETSGEIRNYSWIIDDADQTWRPVVTAPQENPFQTSQVALEKRELSGAFVFMKRGVVGVVKGIHSYGVELLLEKKTAFNHPLRIPPNSMVQLNIADETQGNEINTRVLFKRSEEHQEGTLLCFDWTSGPVQLKGM